MVEDTVRMTGTTLTVGFTYEVQSEGNVGQGEQRLTARLGDVGLDYRHGFVQMHLRYTQLLPAFGANAALQALAEPSEPVAGPAPRE